MLQRKKREYSSHGRCGKHLLPDMRLVLVNKPFHVLPQFTDTAGRATLRDYVPLRGVYPAGRLDYDSEGLVILTDHGPWQARIAEPHSGFEKSYLVQVEGLASREALQQLRGGVSLADGPARAVRAEAAEEPAGLWTRTPPIRFRQAIPTSWIRVVLVEGRNRQVRRMTAAVGLPTLRLIRWSIGPWSVTGLSPGEWRTVPVDDAARLLGGRAPVASQTIKPTARKRRSSSRARVTARS
jgi:23S rRNA pseudouridine2457 synthase